MSWNVSVDVTVNGARYRREVEPRLLLSDFLRQDLGLTGTHVGCEHGVCGACTILFDGEPARACIMLAVQADGHDIRTVESLASPDGELNPLQAAFRSAHGLQCGFCTPGMLMTLTAFLRDTPTPDEVADPRRDLGESLPLHRLPAHRACRPDRGRKPAGRRLMPPPSFGRRDPAQRGSRVCSPGARCSSTM